MKAEIGIGRIWTTKAISPTQGYDRGAGNPREEVGHLGRERALSVGREIRKKSANEQKSAQPTMISVIGQWICLVLGVTCITFGVWGICMKLGQDAPSEHIAWLGSLYMPTLRATAVVCVALGVMLIRRGWAPL
jgi:hypothetical protein